jgi:hypothetical protein
MMTNYPGDTPPGYDQGDSGDDIYCDEHSCPVYLDSDGLYYCPYGHEVDVSEG